ncbi:ornithine decarboxylase 1-like [Leptopilina boulardi]|uniref:ornithine decarboxylase 1-like n=1 Tax=Leptopilina boulardi TaxID=63433 RepID=UPI0021F5ACBE|nr:ornithine decarboxylase 1-like [Leptopilina boulardi]XP_051153630.1 ornithine decarboxylase 1-like [Leptopilina boulardi]XP_051153631.1 ornithine decarboxylase 1-like [Leptopilina boulardi]XP_051153632.1 ornithine decarboxylase 1-like [Leptopilina boulardi]XP_051153633.1 ornithine decarboxylase 1-like [Leptopilina boulardi]
MPTIDISEIKIVDDSFNKNDIINDIIKNQNQEDAFHILDVGEVVSRHKLWLEKIPRVTPYFAVKCNPNPTVIKIIADMNGNFDCASKKEITDVMKYNVSGERIIFANPMKAQSQIKFAKEVGVDKLTADCEFELYKIKDLFPEAKIVIRIRCDSKVTENNLGQKYGCNPNDEVFELINLTKSLNLTLYGFSFHVGSPCGDLNAYDEGIKIAKNLIDYAKSIGCYDACLIDIGGGFPGENDFDLDKIANVINKSIENIDPSIKIISEPGRYYVTAAFTAVAHLIGKKIIQSGNDEMKMYYVNDGTFGSFIEEMLNLKQRYPISLNGTENNTKFLSSLWGPTCDAFDCILKNVFLPDFKVNDWLIWNDMGAYTLACASSFNGFQGPEIYPFIRKKDQYTLKQLISIVNNKKINSQF